MKKATYGDNPNCTLHFQTMYQDAEDRRKHTTSGREASLLHSNTCITNVQIGCELQTVPK
jgi:hypothetical protein